MAATFAFRFAPAVNPRSKFPLQPHCYPTRTLSPTAALQFRPPATHQPLPPLASLCRRGALSVIACADKNGAPSERDPGEGAAGSGAPGSETLITRVHQFGEGVGESSTPDNFRKYLTPVPEDFMPRWVWLIVLAFLTYSWRAVIWELSNWKNTALAMVRWLVTKVIQFIGFFVKPIVTYAPVGELSTILLLASFVLAIAEAASPDSVNNQQDLLLAAGLVSFGIVRGFLPEAVFWLSLVGFFSYSRFIKKRDNVAAALPSVAVLTAVGVPWLRALSLSAYLAFSIFHYSETLEQEKKVERTVGNRCRPPIPLVLAALAIGINLAAMWLRQRHLTWMIV